MSYVKKNARKVFASIAGVIVVATAAVWQFYQFVTFKNEQGFLDLQGGIWLAIAMAVFACVAAFFVFSVYMHHDTDDELHITS